MNLTDHLPSLCPLFPQVVFSLASGNIAGAFEIITSNDSIGEVFVAKPLDREELDHYILKVSIHWLCLDYSQPLGKEWSAPHRIHWWSVSWLSPSDRGRVTSVGLSTVRLMGRG